MPAEGVAVDGMLALEVLGAVLAHHLDAGLGRIAISSSETYFVAATTVTSGPTSARTRS